MRTIHGTCTGTKTGVDSDDINNTPSRKIPPRKSNCNLVESAYDSDTQIGYRGVGLRRVSTYRDVSRDIPKQRRRGVTQVERCIFEAFIARCQSRVEDIWPK